MSDYLYHASIVGTCTLTASLIGAIFAFEINRRQRNKEEQVRVSRGFLDESLLLLRRAYETFTHCGSNPPKNDRVLWMTTARMLVGFQVMRNRITEPDHIIIANTHEEYWRHQFYTLIKTTEKNLILNYFIPSGDVDGVDVIEQRSLTIINDFTIWKMKDGKPDPPDLLDSVNYEEKFLRLGSGTVPIASPYDYIEIVRHLREYPGCWRGKVTKPKNKPR